MPFLAGVAYNAPVHREPDAGATPSAAALKAAMGIYDRDYNRGDRYGDGPGFHLGGPLSVTMRLILVTFGVYVVQLATRQGDAAWFSNFFALHADWYRKPWMAFELLTYGFLHDAADIRHILFNMIGLWMFGRELENRYGPREYVVFYLTAIVFAGLFWMLGSLVTGWIPGAAPVALGASGGVVAIVILYAFNYPHQTILFMFFIPMPMWVFGLLLVAMNLQGSLGHGEQIAYTAHLGGALFAAMYYRSGIRLAQWLPGESWWSQLKFKARRKPKLRVHLPDDGDASDEDDTDKRVDEILKKIQEHGQDSLTRGERRALEEASREYQKRRGE